MPSPGGAGQALGWLGAVGSCRHREGWSCRLPGSPGTEHQPQGGQRVSRDAQDRAHLLRKMLLTSSCVMGGFLELAAILSGRRKLLTRMWSCWTYSASASSMLNTTWFLLRMLSAWGDLM